MVKFPQGGRKRGREQRASTCYVTLHYLTLEALSYFLFHVPFPLFVPFLCPCCLLFFLISLAWTGYACLLFLWPVGSGLTGRCIVFPLVLCAASLNIHGHVLFYFYSLDPCVYLFIGQWTISILISISAVDP